MKMNWNHVTAMLKGTGRYRWAKSEEQTVLTNGHFALLKPVDQNIDLAGDAFASLEKLWTEAMPGPIAIVGALSKVRTLLSEDRMEVHRRSLLSMFPGRFMGARSEGIRCSAIRWKNGCPGHAGSLYRG